MGGAILGTRPDGGMFASSRLARGPDGRLVVIVTTPSLWLQVGDRFLVCDPTVWGLQPERTGRPATARELVWNRRDAPYDCGRNLRAPVEVPDDELDDQEAIRAAGNGCRRYAGSHGVQDFPGNQARPNLRTLRPTRCASTRATWTDPRYGRADPSEKGASLGGRNRGAVSCWAYWAAVGHDDGPDRDPPTRFRRPCRRRLVPLRAASAERGFARRQRGIRRHAQPAATAAVAVDRRAPTRQPRTLGITPSTGRG
jgi:hypothetical protein